MTRNGQELDIRVGAVMHTIRKLHGEDVVDRLRQETIRVMKLDDASIDLLPEDLRDLVLAAEQRLEQLRRAA